MGNGTVKGLSVNAKTLILVLLFVNVGFASKMINKYYAMKAKNKMWPQVSGTSMNSVDHPFGGSSSHAKGIPTQASRNSPPGRKVGKIAPKRTGRRKR